MFGNDQILPVVIPAQAEALFNSEAGQSSFNTSREALKIDYVSFGHLI